MRPAYWPTATAALSQADPTLATLIERYDGEITLRNLGDPFLTLARSITGQQISVKAADAVWRKLEASATIHHSQHYPSHQ